MKLSIFRCLSSLLIVLALNAIVASAQGAPVKTTPAKDTAANSGKEMFKSYCASCHGTDGKGHGPAAAALKTPPADLTMLSSKNGGKFPEMSVYHTIYGDSALAAHGSKEMPVWGPILSDVSKQNQSELKLRLRNLTKYLEEIQAK